MVSKYAELDDALVESISKGRNTFGALCHGATGQLADKLALGFGLSRYSGDRVIDRRLQSLRKRGLILFDGRCWVLVAANQGRPA